jgi:hypothetical protein
VQRKPEKHPKRPQRKTLETRVNNGFPSAFSSLRERRKPILSPLRLPVPPSWRWEGFSVVREQVGILNIDHPGQRIVHGGPRSTGLFILQGRVLKIS